MARVNIYLPDDLAARVKAAGLNVSGVAQDALRRSLEARQSDEWLDGVLRQRPTGVSHHDAAAAVAEAKDDFDRHG